MKKKSVENMTKQELYVYARMLERDLKKEHWHDLRKNPDDLPQPVKLNEFEDYAPLVLVFFYRYDDYGKAAKVYALDRWSGEPFNKWETFYKDDVIAWHELPKFEG